jgi:hypothetical protein
MKKEGEVEKLSEIWDNYGTDLTKDEHQTEPKTNS